MPDADRVKLLQRVDSAEKNVNSPAVTACTGAFDQISLTYRGWYVIT